MKQYNIVDLFAGVGGLSYGFSMLPQFNIIAANEIEKDISIAYTLNHPNVKMLNCDINDLTDDILTKAIDGQKFDIVVGGPPCQSYSTLGKRQNDDRANLFMQYMNIKQIQIEFEELGYDLKHKVLDAVDYGVPQHRERVILVGFKKKQFCISSSNSW